MKELGHLLQIEAFRIVDSARNVGEGEEFGCFGIVLVEIEDFIAGDIAVGAAGNFDREGVFFGIDAEKEERLCR